MAVITTNIELVKNELANENVVAIPTETVYGLAGNAYSEKAIKKIFLVKNRPHYNPLIVHIKGISDLPKIAINIPALALKLANVFWPGSLTLVLEKHHSISNLITAGKSTVAVRIPAHAVTHKLLGTLSFPLVAPSANPFNYLSPTTANHVKSQLGKKISFILDGGKCEKGVESTIIGFKKGKPILLRLGAIAIEEIEEVTGKLIIENKLENTPASPGMLPKHYAPKTALYLTDNVSKLLKSFKNKRIGLLLFHKKIMDTLAVHQEILSESENLTEAASNLFEALHRLDAMDLDLIIAERFPDEGLGKTINDRLERATENN